MVELSRKSGGRLLGALAGSAVFGSVYGHHSPALFDQSRVVTLNATVTKFEWANPHVFIHVEVIEEGGHRESWEVEGDAPSALIPLGWSKDSLKPGDRITVEASQRSLQWPPGTVGRYHNTDPALINYLIRLAVENRGEDYLSFPQRSVFDKIGVRTMIIETDPFGNFLTQGHDLASARDWAGWQPVPSGWRMEWRTNLAGGVQPIRQYGRPRVGADDNPVYGAFFWLNGNDFFPVPRNAYYMSGAGGQTALIIPSHDLVVVRLGHSRGANVGVQSFKNALRLIMEAIPGAK